MTVWRPPSGISRAGSTCTPTCSRSCPRLYPTTASGCSWSTATFSPATPLRLQSGRRRKPSRTCWIVQRTGTLRQPSPNRKRRPPPSRRTPPPRNLPSQRRRRKPALKNRGRFDRRRSYGIYPSETRRGAGDNGAGLFRVSQRGYVLAGPVIPGDIERTGGGQCRAGGGYLR